MIKQTIMQYCKSKYSDAGYIKNGVLKHWERQIETENTSDKAAHAMRVILKDFKEAQKLCWGQCCGFRDHILYREWHAGITWKQECSFGKPTAKKTRKYSHGGTLPNKNCLFKLKGQKRLCALFLFYIQIHNLWQRRSFILGFVAHCHMRYGTFLITHYIYQINADYILRFYYI